MHISQKQWRSVPLKMSSNTSGETGKPSCAYKKNIASSSNEEMKMVVTSPTRLERERETIEGFQNTQSSENSIAQPIAPNGFNALFHINKPSGANISGSCESNPLDIGARKFATTPVANFLFGSKTEPQVAHTQKSTSSPTSSFTSKTSSVGEKLFGLDR